MEIKPGIYRHFKGEHYLVLGVFHHTETGEKYVAYVGLSGFWIRPESSFLSSVEVQGKSATRFSFQKDASAGKMGQVLLDKGKI